MPRIGRTKLPRDFFNIVFQYFFMKERIKSYRQSRDIIKRSLYLSLYSGVRIFFFIRNIAVILGNKKSRNDVIRPFFTKRKAKHYYQEYTDTAENRYPDLFTIARKYLGAKCDIPNNFEQFRILSYGCSTGEEVKSLNDFLPNARIIGTDINLWCIKQARKKFRNKNFRFIQNISDIDEITGDEEYDAIFALAVLQHTINRSAKNDIARKFLFQNFEHEVNKFDNILKPGGLLVIDNTDFDFLDTNIARHYKPLDVQENKRKTGRPVFTTNNKKKSDDVILYRVFVKQIF